MVEITLENLTAREIQLGGTQFMQLCRLTSPGEAVAMCKRFGGMVITMPTEERKCSGIFGRYRESTMRLDLRDMLTEKSYSQLLFEVGGSSYEFPKLTKLLIKRRNTLIKKSVDAMREHGVGFEKSILDLVIDFGVTRRHLYRIMKTVD